jgi:complement component 1 Q subcomponent-binding protein, mitochondrial
MFAARLLRLSSSSSKKTTTTTLCSAAARCVGAAAFTNTTNSFSGGFARTTTALLQNQSHRRKSGNFAFLPAHQRSTFSSSCKTSSSASFEEKGNDDDAKQYQLRNQRRGEERGGVSIGGRGRFLGRRSFSADAGSSSSSSEESEGAVTTTSSSSSSSESARLSAILRAEIKHEAESYEQSETAKGGPPDGWTLSEREGDCDVYLSKEFGEDEEILVHFSASDDPMETEYGRDDDNGVDDVIDEGLGDEDIEEEFSVTVSKTGSGKQLEFFCVTDGELIEIQHVQYEGFEWNEGGGGEGGTDGGDDDAEGEGILFDEEFDDNNYPGPHFEDLDKGVQDAFLSYLEERGINAALADYIVEKRIDKEQKEYTSWLEKVADFLK